MVTLTEWTAIVSAAPEISATVFITLQLRHIESHRNLEISMKLFEGSESERLLDGSKTSFSLKTTRSTRLKKRKTLR